MLLKPWISWVLSWKVVVVSQWKSRSFKHQYCIYIHIYMYWIYYVYIIIIIILYINHNYICEYVWLALKLGGLFDKLSVYLTTKQAEHCDLTIKRLDTCRFNHQSSIRKFVMSVYNCKFLRCFHDRNHQDIWTPGENTAFKMDFEEYTSNHRY